MSTAVTGQALGNVSDDGISLTGSFTDFIGADSGTVCLYTNFPGPCGAFDLNLTAAAITISGPGTYFAPFTATGLLVVQSADGTFARFSNLSGTGIAEIVMQQNGFTTFGPSSVTWTFSAVPEPSAYALAGSGLAFARWMRRRRNGGA